MEHRLYNIPVVEIKETRSQWGAPGRIRALYYTEYRRSSLGRIAMTFPFKKTTMPWASIKPQTGQGLANMYTGTVRLYEQHSTSKMLSRTRYIFSRLHRNMSVASDTTPLEWSFNSILSAWGILFWPDFELHALPQKHKKQITGPLQPTGPKGNPRHSTISQHLSQCRLTCCDGLSTKGENQQMKPWWLEDWLEALMILMFPKRHPRPWAVTLVFAFIVHSCFLLHSCFRIDSTGRFLQISSWVWKPLEKRTGPFLLFPCRSRTISEWWLLQSKKMTDQHPQIWSLLAFMPFLRKQIMPNPDRSPHFHGLCGQSARIGQGGRYLEIIRAVCPVSVKAIISLPQTQLMLACCLDC